MGEKRTVLERVSGTRRRGKNEDGSDFEMGEGFCSVEEVKRREYSSFAGRGVILVGAG
jgi:hypothetical protein